MRCYEIQPLESRVLLSTLAFDGDPITIDTSSSFLTPSAIAPIGTSGNYGFFDIKQDGQHHNLLFFQSLDPRGLVVVPSMPITSTSQPIDAFAPLGAAQDPQGNDVVVFGNFPDLFAMKVDPAGQVLVPPIAITQQTSDAAASSPAIAFNPTSGNIAVTYLQSASSMSSQGMAVILNSSLVPGGSPFALTPAQAGSGGGNIISSPLVQFDPALSNFDFVFKSQQLSAGFGNLGQSILGGTFNDSGAPAPTGPFTLFEKATPDDVLSAPILVQHDVYVVWNTFGNSGLSTSSLMGVDANGFQGGGGSQVLVQHSGPAAVAIVGGAGVQNPEGDVEGVVLLVENETFNGGGFTPANMGTVQVVVDQNGLHLSSNDPVTIPYTQPTDPMFPFIANPLIAGDPFPGLFVQPVPNSDANTTTLLAQPFTLDPSILEAPTTTPATFTATNGHPATFHDASGNLLVVDIDGPGKVKGKLRSNGIIDVTISGTDADTAITFKPKQKHHRFEIHNITSKSPVGAVVGPYVDITGNVDLHGASLIDLGNVQDDHQVSLGHVNNVVLKFGHVSSTDLTASGSIKSLSAVNWLGGSITATTIGSVSTSAAFDADVSANSITKLTVAGALGGTSNADVRTIRAKQSIGDIAAGSAAHVHIFAGVKSAIAALPSSRSAFVKATDSLGSFVIKGPTPLFSDAIIAAPIIGTIKILGLLSTNATPFGVVGERISSYVRGSVHAKKVFSARQIDSVDQYRAATV